MAKKICVCCKKALGPAVKKTAIADGVVCRECLNRSGIETFPNAASYDAAALTELLSARRSMAETFCPTKKIEKYLHLDEEHRLIRIGKDIVSYENLTGYEFFEDKVSVLKSGPARVDAAAVLTTSAAGFSFGKKTKRTSSSMKLQVNLKDTYTDSLDIIFLQSEVKTKDILYRSMHSFAQSCIAELDWILHPAQEQEEEAKKEAAGPDAPVFSAADEIRKFKALMDEGIITPEEFEAEKKKLLDL